MCPIGHILRSVDAMEKNTRERILDGALESFAENGYSGTNLRDLAANLGLSKSALYRHFDSKEAIWNAVIDTIELYYGARFGSPENIHEAPKACDELFEMTMRMINFTMHDEKIILARRVLLTEQFHDKRAAALATRHFLTGTQEIFKGIFAEMIKNGILKNCDPGILALTYTAPVTELIHRCDREPEKEPEIIEKIEAFLRNFIEEYAL